MAEILQNVDKSKLMILMDHQPSVLDEAIENHIDIQLSGHTHKGQFFPFNLLTRKIFELDYGYRLKGNTHFYVSSGYGTWGPPVRICSKPEIVFFEIQL